VARATDVTHTLATYYSVVPFLSELLGEDSEVLLYEARDAEGEAVLVASAGRRLSDDDVLPTLVDETGALSDAATDDPALFAESLRGPSAYRSRALAIRDESGASTGVLLVTTDIRPFLQARDVLNSYILPRGYAETDARRDSAPAPADELAESTIRDHVEASALNPQLMSAAERREFVGGLDRAGSFLIKGAVKEAATALRVSESTVYRYLAEYRNEAGHR
jgi:predicted transcriptional regulator YheO